MVSLSGKELKPELVMMLAISSFRRSSDRVLQGFRKAMLCSAVSPRFLRNTCFMLWSLLTMSHWLAWNVVHLRFSVSWKGKRTSVLLRANSCPSKRHAKTNGYLSCFLQTRDEVTRTCIIRPDICAMLFESVTKHIDMQTQHITKRYPSSFLLSRMHAK